MSVQRLCVHAVSLCPMSVCPVSVCPVSVCTLRNIYNIMQLDESEENRAIAMETALLGFLYYCSRGNFRDAHYLSMY